MIGELFHWGRKAFLSMLCALSLLALLAPWPAQGAGAAQPMQSYCDQPPFATAGMPANLLLMIDNSASMYDPAYINRNSPSTYCLDDSFDGGNSYTGYFDPKSFYSYDLAKSRFVPGATLPSPPCGSSACAASTNYLYVEMAGVSPNRTVSAFKASGNFLNWLSMSKIDVEKKVLTGGKFTFSNTSTASGVLQGETRGCQGKRFVKMLGADAFGWPVTSAASITFAVRGPMMNDPGYLPQTSRGGATTIEIYDKAYNKADCLDAVQAWLSQDKDRLAAKANACMSVATDPAPRGGTMTSSAAINNLILSDCYTWLVAKGPVTPDNTLWGDCKSRYTGTYGTQTPNSNTMDGICGKNVQHSPNLAGGTAGYFGKCAGLTISLTNSCLVTQMTDYCNEIKNPWVSDPSTNANLDPVSANIPGFILDAGISNLGTLAGAFKVSVWSAAPPAGLIQQFSNSINFGAMVFNANGAGSECASGKLPCVKHCRLNTGLECSQASDCTGNSGPCDAGADGGKIISYINDPASPVGDHATGLVAAIDAVTANAWTPLAESFYDAIGYFANRTDLRLQSADFDTVNKPAPSNSSCQRNNVLIVSDGMSTADSNSAMEALAALYGNRPGAATGKDAANSCPAFEGSRSLDDLAWIAAHKNIKTFSTSSVSSDAPVTRGQSITTHVIFTGASNGAPGECDPAVLLPNAAANGGGVYASVTDPNQLYDSFKAVLRQIADGADSGTDATLLATGNGNGAVFLGEQFYPTKSFDGGTTAASWIGEMQSLWYYIDPFIANTSGAGSTIREDTDGDLKLNLKNDRVVQFQDNTAQVFLDADGDGAADDATQTQTVAPNAVKTLWRAGTALWQRSAADRTIYTQTNGTALTSFASLGTYPNAVQLLQAKDQDEANNIIKYVTGEDTPYVTEVNSPSYRSRTLAIPAGAIAGVAAGSNVWKLGDILSSTPKVQSSVALGGYHLPTPSGYGDASYGSFIGSNQYQSRGAVYVGANDGMLHAFNLGQLTATAAGDVRATLAPKAGETTADLGKEKWAFIPRNALPYLTYLKEPSYRHIYYVDGGIALVDASIGDTNSGACSKASYWNCPKLTTQRVVTNLNSLDPVVNTWRTVMIGAMGLGGASGGSCDPGGTGGQCVPTPTADPAGSGTRLGYSSYFALDVTDPDNPSLLWEFSNPGLGYSTTGPAIVRIGDPNLDGRWFAVFGSGPTGPIDASYRFLAQSNQELKFFVVDLRTGELVATIATGIANAFAGSMSGAAIDADRWKGSYQDDVLYIGYTKANSDNITPATTWTAGGVIRILTGENRDPSQWKASKVIDGIGPVTSGIARIQDRKNRDLWLYFGTGRYYFGQDDLQGQRALYGIKDTCYKSKTSVVDKFDVPTCTDQVTASLIDQTTTQRLLAATDPGWIINLDAGSGAVGAERVITNPISSAAGTVFFATFQPNADPCLGDSYLWGVKYDTGGAIPAGSIQGKALVQLSTGRVQETGLANGLTGQGNRRTPAMTGGKPGGVKVISNSGLRPLKKIVHIQER